MLRQVRIEFEGALYHVMARGDRREAIVEDDEDRKTFVRTLGEAAEKTGFRIWWDVFLVSFPDGMGGFSALVFRPGR